ncbi:triacylglycerol lipase, partial [Streptomyces sp. NPDC059409]
LAPGATPPRRAAAPPARPPPAPAAAATGPSATTSRGVEIPAFYTPPSELPGADGTVIRSEPLPLALSLPGIDGPLPGRATRLMYKSTDANGEAVAVTGAYIEPAASWRGARARPQG